MKCKGCGMEMEETVSSDGTKYWLCWDCYRSEEKATNRLSEEIPRIIEELEDLWRECPSLRLGQLIYTLVNRGKIDSIESLRAAGNRVFYTSDEELLKIIVAAKTPAWWD